MIRELASSLWSDFVLFSTNYGKIKSKVDRFDAVVTGVLSFPWDSYLAHVAAMLGKPVVVWQHGEKGQSVDRSTAYTELLYTTSYLAYAEGVAKLYRPFIGAKRLSEVSVVGSLGKVAHWRGGDSVVYATGKWFKTCSPMMIPSDPDNRLFHAHKAILGFLDEEARARPIIFKANNTAGLNEVPYQFKNIRVERDASFTELLERASLVILDTPATTLVEACSTNVPIFVLGGRSIYEQEFLDLVKRRVVWCDSVDEIIDELRAFLDTGLYRANVHDTSYRDAFSISMEADTVVRIVGDHLETEIASYKRELE